MAQNNPFFGNPLDKVTDEIRSRRYELPDFSEVSTPSRAQGSGQGQQYESSGGLLPPPELEPLFLNSSREHQVPLNVLMAIGQQESSYNPNAIGPETQWGNAKGMMQYIDDTAEGMGIDPLDPAQAVDATARQFKDRLSQGYSVEEAVMAHFAGDDRRQWGPKTRQYARDVLSKAGSIREQWRPPEGSRVRGITSDSIKAAEQVAGDTSIERARADVEEAAGEGDREASEKLDALREQAQDPDAVDALSGADRKIKEERPNTPLDLIRQGLSGASDFLSAPASEFDFLTRRAQGPDGSEQNDGPASSGSGMLGDVTGNIEEATSDPAGFSGERARDERDKNAVDAFTGAAPSVDDREWTGWAENLAKSVVGGAGGSVAASIEGAGLIGQQAENVEASNQLAEATKKFESARESLAQILEANEGEDDKVTVERAQKQAENLAQAEIEFHRELVNQAEREPDKVSAWLREKGVDLGELAQTMQADPEYQGVATDIAGGVGSMLTYLGPGFLSTLMSRGSTAAMRGVSGIAGASALAGPAGAAEAYQRANEYGLPEEEAVRIAMKGIPAGVVQVAPVATILKKIPQGVRGKAISQFRHILESFGAEFTAEGAGAVMQNLVEKSYDEDKGVWDDSLYQAAIGGSSAALITLGVQAATRGKGVGPLDAGDLGRELDKNVRRAEWNESPEMEALRVMDPGGYLDAIRSQVEQVDPEAVLAGDLSQAQGPAPEGPIERAAVETAGEAKVENVPGERVSVETRTGRISGTVEDYYEDGRGAFQVQVLSDDGEMYVFDQDSQAVVIRDSVMGEGDAESDRASDTAATPDVPAMADVENREAPDEQPAEAVNQEVEETAAPQVDAEYEARANTREEYLPQAETEQDVQDLIDAEVQDRAGMDTDRRNQFMAAANTRIAEINDEARSRAIEEAAQKRESERQEQESAQAEVAETGEPIVEHMTRKGKIKRGVLRDIPLSEAKQIDEYAFRKQGKSFINLSRLDNEPAAPAAQEAQEATSEPDVQMKTDGSPFATYESAQRAMTNRRVKGRVVQVREGEWGIQPEQAAGTAEQGASQVRGDRIDDEWSSFSEASGTRNVPRAEMPQIQAKHRGALANFLSARGIESSEETVRADSLKPTQREFSEERVQAAKEREGGDRAILASSDGHIVDGHHQWLSRVDAGEDVRIIRLNAPIDRVLEQAAEFPSSEVDDGNNADQRNEKPGIEVDNWTQAATQALDRVPENHPMRRKWVSNVRNGLRSQSDREGVLKAIQEASKQPPVSENTVFTEDAAEKARALLRSKLGNLNAGVDPEVMQAGITLAGYHIEKGARTFAAYARAMVDDMGEGVKPYLKSWYMGVKYDPRAADFEGLDDAATVDAADVDAVLSDVEEADAAEAVADTLESPAPSATYTALREAVASESMSGTELIRIARIDADESMTPLFDRLEAHPSLADLTVEIDNTGRAAGRYSPSQHNFKLDEQFLEALAPGSSFSTSSGRSVESLFSETVAHELVHAVTAREIRQDTDAPGGGKFGKRLLRLQDDIRQFLDNPQAMESLNEQQRKELRTMADRKKGIYEIPTLALTSPSAKAALKMVKSRESASGWSQFVEAVRTLLKMPPGTRTLLDDLMIITDEIIQTGEREALQERRAEVSEGAEKATGEQRDYADRQIEHAERRAAEVESESREDAPNDTQRDSAGSAVPLVDTTPETNVPAEPGADPARVDGVRPASEAGNGQPESNRTRREDGMDRGEMAGVSGTADAGRSVDGNPDAGAGGGHRAPASDPLGRTADLPNTLKGENPGNFVIPDDFGLGQGTVGQKIKANLDALAVMKRANDEGRFATPDEQKTLARYVGWGGLSQVFDPKNRGKSNQYGRAHAWLKENLTEQEFAAASRSIQDAHYTSDKIVGMMWRAARHFGFKGGRAIEPTVGTGNFLGLEPADLAGATEWHASELDSVSGRIAQLLYPEANILAATSFQDAPFADGVMDLAIGNPPFGSQPIRDRSKRRGHLDGMKIHNYIIAKAGMHLRPGGVMQMVVTHRFLDTADTQGRAELAKHFRFLGAVRLPNDAFRATAGTDVTTDMVYLQKLRADEKPDNGASWLDTNGEIDVDGTNIRVNRYFQENPDNILGKSSMAGSMYRGQGQEYTVESDGRDIEASFNQLLERGSLSSLAGVMTETPADKGGKAVMLEQSDLPVGGMTLTAEGAIIQRDLDDSAGNAVINRITPESYWKEQAAQWGDVIDAAKAIKAAREDARPISAQDIQDFIDASGVATTAAGGRKPKPTKAEQAVYDLMDAVQSPNMAWTFDDGLAAMEATFERKRLGRKGYDTLRKLLDLRNRTHAVLRAERTDDPAMEALRKELDQAYDAFRDTYGLISDPSNLSLLSGDVGVEVGLEVGYKPEIKPAEARAMGVKPSKATASKADILQRRVTWPERVIESADNVVDGMNISLSERGKLDLAYIAGLVDKPQQAVIRELTEQEAIFYDPEQLDYVIADEYLSGNVKHKLEVARQEGAEDNIKALEAVQPEPKTKNQITPSIRGTWLPASMFENFLGALGVKAPKVLVQPSIGRISARESIGDATELGLQFSDPDATMTQMFNAASSGKSMKIMRRDGEGSTYEDKASSQRVTAKAERMAQVFTEWAYSDGERTDTVVDAYNRVMNTHRQREWNGEKYLKTVGQSPSVKLRRTQKNAAWRMIQSQNVLTDHVVGSGKAQPLDAKILTPSGWVAMGDIQPGDMVIARNGQQTEVEAVFPQGEKEIFRVMLSDGSSTECCEEHLWLTQTYRERGYSQRATREGKEWPCGQGKVRSLAEIRETLEAPHLGAKNHSIPMVEPVEFAPREVPVDPYLLGALLGDGHIGMKAVSLSGEDAEIIERCRLPDGVKVRHQAPEERCQSWHFIGERQGFNPMLVAMREMGLAGKLSHEKQIPEGYRFNSVDVRLEVLRGLMDTDGTVSKSGHSAYFTTVSPALADDVTFLVQSLGGKVSRSTKVPSYRHNGELRQGRESIQLTVSMPAALNPFAISRKAGALKPKTSRGPSRYIVGVESIGMKEAQCIRVADKEHLYVTDDFIVTHNTFTLITGIMERKRLGLSRKPVIAVPNHLVVQWASEFYQLYPGARILAATPDDFAKKNRRRLFARMATGDYDAIIMGHSSFGFVEAPAQDVKGVIDANKRQLKTAMEEMKRSGESGRTLKQMEKKLDTYDDQLKALAERPVDQMGIDMEAMGVDYLAVDEAHMFKNLEYATSGERVVGMNDPKGSKRSFDLYAKVRGIQERQGGVAFATGTPVSNSLVELYTMMRYLAHDSLKQRDQDHFDAWAGAYAVTETRMEYTATQKLKPRRVLSGLANLDGLGQLYREFADIITMDDLKRIYAEEVRERNAKTGGNERAEFPVPKVKHGGRQLDTAQITQQQSEYMDYLVARMQMIEQKKSDPEYARIDNPLWVLSDARKMSLDIRVVDPTAERDESGKVMRSARKIKDLYDRWDADKGTQLVFSDLSTPSKTSAGAARKIVSDGLKVVFGESEARQAKKRLKDMSMVEQWKYVEDAATQVMDDPAIASEKVEKIEEFLEKNAFADSTMIVADTGFSVYDDLRNVLTEMGIPASEVAFIHDYNTPDQKSRLFARVNSGSIRVLIGSTEKMGAGTNAQERLVGLHHLDAPWRPSDVEQREGRIIRQGNVLYQREPDGFEVEIDAYSTNGTSDTVMWQVLERKAGAIEQFRKAGLDAMEEDAADSDQYAEFMATSTGNPVFKLKLEAERDLTNTQAEVGGKLIAVQNARTFMDQYPDKTARLSGRIESLDAMNAGDIVYGDANGDAAGLTAAIEKAEQAFMDDYAAWQKKRDKAEVEREEARAAGKKKLPAIPQPPSRPGPLSASVVKESGYAQAVKSLLEDVGSGNKGDKRNVTATIGNVTVNAERVHNSEGEPYYYVTADIGEGGRTFLARSEARNPAESSVLAKALMPEKINSEIALARENAANALQSLEARLPREEKLAKQNVSDKPITDAQRLLDWYKDQVKIAEYEADVKRGERPNRYINAERRRPLQQFKAREEVESKQFNVDGDTYTTTGLAAVEGQVTIHDATRDSDGRRAMVYEQKTGENEVNVTAAIEPDAARQQMRSATAQSNARQRIREPRMSVAEAEQRIRQGRNGEAASKLLESRKVRVTDSTPGDVPNSTAAYVDEQGVINLVARNMDPEYAEATLLHEAFHAGTRPLIGGRRWNELQDRLRKLHNQAERSTGRNRQFWESARARIAAAERAGDVMDEARRVEEFGAYALEEFDSAPRTLRQWASDMAGRVQAWLQRNFGIQVGEVSPAQLRALAAAALRNGDMAPSPSFDMASDQLVDTEGSPVPEAERRAEVGKAVRSARKALSVVSGDQGVRDADGGVTRDILKITALTHQPYTIASMEPQFTPVFRTAMAQMRFRDTIISEMYPRFRAYKELRQAGRAKVNQILELGRLTGMSFPDSRLQDGVENKGYKTVITYDTAGLIQRRREPLNTALSKQGDVIKLSKAEREAYSELRAMFDEALDLFRDQTLIDMDMAQFVGSSDPTADILNAIDDSMSDAMKERYQNIAKMVEEIEQAKRTGYVPLSRYGRFVITVKEKIADVTYAKNPDGGFIARGVPEALDDFMREIGAAYNDLEGGWQVSDGQRRQLNRETTRTVYSEKLDPEKYSDRWETWRASKNGKNPRQLGFVKEARARIEAEWGGDNRSVSVVDTKRAPADASLKLSDIDSLADLAQVDNETWSGIRDDFVKAMRGRGFRKHFFRAENVPGYELDFERAIADYMASMAGYLSRRHHEQQWEDSISGVKGPELNKYAKEYRDYVNNPQEEHAVLRQTGFLFYIAGNVSTALLNSTQVPIMTMPALSQVMPHTKAARHVTGAYKDVLAMTSMYDLAREGWQRGGVRGAADMALQMFDPKDAPADVRDEVQAAWDDGMFAPQFTHEVMGFSNRRDGSPQAKLEKTIDYVASSYTYIERLNRLVTFIAAVRAAKDPKVQAKANSTLKGNALARMSLLGDNWSPKAFGEFIVDESQFMMGKTNRATMLRSHGAAVFQFMSFVINSLQAWYRWSTINGRGGKMAAAYSIGAITALSGVWGAPGMDYLRKGIEGLWTTLVGEDEDLRYNLREWIGEQTGSDMLGEIADKGIFYPLGADMSGRIGFMRMLPDMTDPISMLGIPADLLIGRPTRAVQASLQGNYGGAVAELAPQFLKNPITAREWSRKGVVSRAGSQAITPEQLPRHAYWYKALGIQPSIVSDAWEYRYSRSRIERKYSTRTSRMVNKIARAEADASRNEDQSRQPELEARIERLYNEVDEFNMENPDHAIDPRSLIRRVNSKVNEYLYGLDQMGPVPSADVERAQEVYNIDDMLERGREENP